MASAGVATAHDTTFGTTISADRDEIGNYTYIKGGIGSPKSKCVPKRKVADSISFVASASDPQDGELSGSSIVWTSDLDGQIGTRVLFDLLPICRDARNNSHCYGQ